MLAYIRAWETSHFLDASRVAIITAVDVVREEFGKPWNEA